MVEFEAGDAIKLALGYLEEFRRRETNHEIEVPFVFHIRGAHDELPPMAAY